MPRKLGKAAPWPHQEPANDPRNRSLRALAGARRVSLVLGIVPLAGAQRGRADWMALARPARGRAGRRWSRMSFACLTAAFVRQRLLGALRRASTPTARCRWPTASPAVWGGHEGSLLLWVLMLVRLDRPRWRCFSRAPAAAGGGAHPRRDGLRRGRLPALHAAHLEPLRPAVPGARRRPRPEPAAAGPGHGHPPADALHGLCRLLGGLRLRGGGADRRQPRLAMGALDAAVDHGRLDVPDPGHRARQLVGLLRARLGRLVVLGPGRERLVHALAGGHRADPFAGRDREARRASRPGRCCWRSWRSRCRCWAPSSSARACCPRCTPSPPTRARGLFILAFLAVVIGASLALYAWRAPKRRPGRALRRCSRARRCCSPTTCCWSAAMAAVLLGTLYPLVLDALGLGKISVGPPYFDTVFVPLMAPLVFLMGVGPLARWKQASLPDLARAAALGRRGRACVAALAAGWARGPHLAGGHGRAADGLLDRRQRGGRPVGAHAAARRRAASWPARALLPRAMVGMMVAHLGVAVFIFGVTMVKSYEVERDVKMARRRHDRDRRLRLHLPWRARGRRAELPRRAALDRGQRATAARWPTCSPRSASTACSTTR